MSLQEHINTSIKAMRAVQVAESGQITLGTLIGALEAISVREEPQRVVFDFEYAAPTNFYSWRGIYAELAIGFDFNSEKLLPDLISEAKGAVGATFNGYKGGEFVMTKDTPVWVANYGNSGSTAILGVHDEGWRVVLLTGYRPT